MALTLSLPLSPEERRELLHAIEENKLLMELFDHPGYKHLAKKVQEMHDTANTIADVKNEADLNYRKGQMDILRWLLSYPSMVQATLQANVEAAEAL